MTEQRPPGAIEWCRIWGRRGFTANPVRGCMHQCKWRMPDGTIAICYAKDMALTRARPYYPNGFESLSFHPDELKEIEQRKEPAGIFIDSMSDLFGAKVEKEWIQATLETMVRCPQHIFFSLTKNAHRLQEFALPENLYCGISSPPTHMFGKQLTVDQQHLLFRSWIRCLVRSTATVRWISFEPLTIDVTDYLTPDYLAAINWSVLGAASSPGKTHQPDQLIFTKTVQMLDAAKIPIFMKGNLNRAYAESVAGRWREDFPPERAKLKQESLQL